MNKPKEPRKTGKVMDIAPKRRSVQKTVGVASNKALRPIKAVGKRAKKVARTTVDKVSRSCRK